MNLMDKVHSGRRSRPPRLMVYGIEGIGKSTLASQAPKAIFIPTEDGLDQIACDSFPLAKSFADVESAIGALVMEDHDYQSVVVDSADWLERLIWDKLCEDYGVDSIEKVDGGYARGYTHALTCWRRIIDGMETLRLKRDMCVIILAHAKVETFADPEHTAYDRYSPRLHKHANALLCEWLDAILFATRKIITKSEDAGFNKTRTIASGLGKNGGDRILRCVGSPACVAKNRYSLPGELPLAWQPLFDGILANINAASTEQAEVIDETTSNKKDENNG
ncbi:MAG TPA: ATP-binding protein [Phycisphaerae bacterium]|nr:ATP-binding protein [Phycisphaerae bacterium]